MGYSPLSVLQVLRIVKLKLRCFSGSDVLNRQHRSLHWCFLAAAKKISRKHQCKLRCCLFKISEPEKHRCFSFTMLSKCCTAGCFYRDLFGTAAKHVPWRHTKSDVEMSVDWKTKNRIKHRGGCFISFARAHTKTQHSNKFEIQKNQINCIHCYVI